MLDLLRLKNDGEAPPMYEIKAVLRKGEVSNLLARR
jgi:hypothetical protein